jgi:hypothetical protein
MNRKKIYKSIEQKVDYFMDSDQDVNDFITSLCILAEQCVKERTINKNKHIKTIEYRLASTKGNLRKTRLELIDLMTYIEIYYRGETDNENY